jgi:Ca2+-transporting ATPase
MAAGTLFVLDASLPGGFVDGSGDLRYAQTMAFTTFMLFPMFKVVNARSVLWLREASKLIARATR